MNNKPIKRRDLAKFKPVVQEEQVIEESEMSENQKRKLEVRRRLQKLRDRNQTKTQELEKLALKKEEISQRVEQFGQTLFQKALEPQDMQSETRQ